MKKGTKLILQMVLFIVLLVIISMLYSYIISIGTNQGEENKLEPIEEEVGVEIPEVTGKEEFDKILDEKKVVFVDFYATWCMPCKKMSPVIEELSKEYPDICFIKVDVDENEELAMEYSVLSIPTMVIIKDKEEVKKFVGVVDKEKIVQELETMKESEVSKTEERNMYLKIKERTLTVSLENNSSALALLEKLKQGDITIDMQDYANFEKVGPLGFDLPRNDKQMTTQAGDVILYQGNQITIYYDTNSWNFTKLGHIDTISQEELKQILGNDRVSVTLSLNQ